LFAQPSSIAGFWELDTDDFLWGGGHGTLLQPGTKGTGWRRGPYPPKTGAGNVDTPLEGRQKNCIILVLHYRVHIGQKGENCTGEQTIQGKFLLVGALDTPKKWIPS